MCLSEPQAGSSLSDVATRAPRRRRFEADPLGPALPAARQQDVDLGRRARAHREHRPPGAGQDPGPDGRRCRAPRGISLFIVPKQLVDAEGRLTGERNDVALAGLNHKLGWRGTTNTLLNFGEGRYPVRGAGGPSATSSARPGEGLRCMFHMMNEARIGVGLAATMLGMAGYEASLDYARNRPQGRPVGRRQGRGAAAGAASSSTPTSSACCWRRRPMRRRAGAELYCARWSTSSTPATRRRRRGQAAAGGADADRQELAQRMVPGGQQRWPSRSTAATATRATSRWSSTGATTA